VYFLSRVKQCVFSICWSLGETESIVREAIVCALFATCLRLVCAFWLLCVSMVAVPSCCGRKSAEPDEGELRHPLYIPNNVR
jgi:uncharacterized membrane protein YfbV (UPF0208 family)